MPLSLQQRIYLGFAVALALLVVIGAVAYRTTATLTETAIAVKETHESLTRLEAALSRITEAESAQRGFVITGDETWLPVHGVATADRDRRAQGNLQSVCRAKGLLY